MSDTMKFENLNPLLVELRGERILLDSDVAQIYGVETRDINKAVTNNPDKFPAGYVVELSKQEKSELVENFHRFNKLKHSTVNPKAFPEKGLYMYRLLKIKLIRRHSCRGVENWIAGIFDDDLQTSDTETSIELNFAALKFKHTIKKKKK
jgi:hypothetical protein